MTNLFCSVVSKRNSRIHMRSLKLWLKLQQWKVIYMATHNSSILFYHLNLCLFQITVFGFYCVQKILISGDWFAWHCYWLASTYAQWSIWHIVLLSYHGIYMQKTFKPQKIVHNIVFGFYFMYPVWSIALSLWWDAILLEQYINYTIWWLRNMHRWETSKRFFYLTK